MEKDISQMSMLEVAVMLMEQKRNPQAIKKILEETLQMKGLDDPTGELAAQLYVDITTSSKFVYMGDDQWDLKSRQSLDKWDLDGSAFNSDDVADDEDEVKVSDYDYDDVADDEENEDSNDSEVDDYDYDNDNDEEDNDEYDRITDNSDDDFDDENDFDEEDYEGYMDDYENLYDK
ncbi:MAG: DNA-directed RNA polymerase subunit delta [Anaeroplasmataceae bacterium]